MTMDQLEDYLTGLPDEIMGDIPEIVAEVATGYFQETFDKKAFDGKPWAPLKKEKHHGSLLVTSGNLLNSIRPAYIGPDKVIISAGNDKVPYAQAHNEGFTGSVVIPAHTRSSKKGKSVSVSAHTIRQNIPQREFMGKSDELASRLHDRIQNHLNSKL
jgi:phage gpG-like protein